MSRERNAGLNLLETELAQTPADAGRWALYVRMLALSDEDDFAD